MKNRALLAAFGVVFAFPCAAQSVGGSYEVQGTNHNGSRYGGTAQITLTSDTTCEIEWDTGSTSKGICARNGDSFAAAYAMDRAIGLVIYKLNKDGSMEGLWTIAGQPGTGTEMLIPK